MTYNMFSGTLNPTQSIIETWVLNIGTIIHVWIPGYGYESLVYLHYTHTHTQPFYGPLSGTTRVSRCQKRTIGLYGARED